MSRNSDTSNGSISATANGSVLTTPEHNGAGTDFLNGSSHTIGEADDDDVDMGKKTDVCPIA